MEKRDELLIEAVDMGEIDVLEEDLLPDFKLCDNCSC
jgi:hypothetical protein